MEKTNIRVDFRILGNNYDIQRISNSLNIEPTHFWNIGDNIRQTSKKREYTCWILSTGYEETLDVNTQLIKIQELLMEKTILLNELKESYDLNYNIEVIIKIENGEVPAIYIESETIQFAASIGARFDFDTYIN